MANNQRSWPGKLLWSVIGAGLGFGLSVGQYNCTSEKEYQAHIKRTTMQWIGSVVDEIDYNTEHWTAPEYPLYDKKSGELLFLRRISTESLRAFLNIQGELDLPDTSIVGSAWDLLEWTSSANDLVEFYNSHVKPTDAGVAVDTLKPLYQSTSAPLKNKLIAISQSLQ